MTQCIQESLNFPQVKKALLSKFPGRRYHFGWCVMLLRQADRCTERSCLPGTARQPPASKQHDGLSILRQQIYALASAYGDLNCFPPVYAFCQDQLLVSYLRPSNIDGARHAWAILSLLVKRCSVSRQLPWPMTR